MNNEAIVIQLLLQNSPIWVAFMLGFVPALVASVKQRPKTRWYLYGLLCALVAWPLVTLPTIHALLLRRRIDAPEPMGQRRRADALALLKEASVRSYPSWIVELSSKSRAGADRHHYAYRNLRPGEALELVREPFNASEITPLHITIAPFASASSPSDIGGSPRLWMMDFPSRPSSKMSSSTGSFVGVKICRHTYHCSFRPPLTRCKLIARLRAAGLDTADYQAEVSQILLCLNERP